jgi:hypothetical protein
MNTGSCAISYSCISTTSHKHDATSAAMRQVFICVILWIICYSWFMPGGRPTAITKKQTQLICDLLADGRSFNTVCAALDLPRTTIQRWIRDNAKFRSQYQRAKKWQARFAVEDCIAIADDTSRDLSGELQIPNGVAVQRDKLRIDTRLKVAAKLLPKKYGDQAPVNQQTVNVGLQLVHDCPRPQRDTKTLEG